MSCYTGAYPLRSSLFALLSESSLGFGSLDHVIHHLVSSVRVRGRTYINRPCSSSPCHVSFRVGTAPISIDHLPVMSVSSRDRTYIDRPSPCHVSLCLSRGRTYIDRLSPYHVSFRVGTAPISIGHHLISLSLSRDRTYIDQPSPYHVSSV